MVTKIAQTPETHVPHSSHTLLTVLLIVSVLMSGLCLYFLLGYSIDLKSLSSSANIDTKIDSSIGIRRVLLDLEYEKVWGKENYDILQKYSQMQIKEQIPKIRQYVEWGANPATPTPNAPTTQGTMTPEEVQAVLSDASIEGNKSANIIAIEYSDMECPFCMKQYHDTKLFSTLLAEYKDKIGVAFKNNRWVNHKWTEVKALGALCAGKIWGDGAYQRFYQGVMDGSTNGWGPLPVDKLADIAKSASIDVAKWQKCVDAKETLPRFVAQTAEANKYWLGGTPGTLILNVKTGKYDTVEWAYPYATFKSKIDALMK